LITITQRSNITSILRKHADTLWGIVRASKIVLFQAHAASLILSVVDAILQLHLQANKMILVKPNSQLSASEIHTEPMWKGLRIPKREKNRSTTWHSIIFGM